MKNGGGVLRSHSNLNHISYSLHTVYSLEEVTLHCQGLWFVYLNETLILYNPTTLFRKLKVLTIQQTLE